MSTETKTISELDLLPIPKDAKDVMTKIIGLFADQGHSGFSAGYLIPRVIAFANLTSDEIEDLMYCKEKDCDEDEDEMQRMITDNVKELVAELEPLKGPYFHFYLDILKKLMQQEPVTPITFEDDQWIDVGKYYGDGKAGNHFQHKRAYNVFKDNDKIYQSDYFVFNNNALYEDSYYTGKLSQKTIESESWIPAKVNISYDFVKEVYNTMQEDILENNISSIKELKKEIERLLYENEKLNKVNGCICANSCNSETLGYIGPADEPMSPPDRECPGSAPSSRLI